jgi:DNA-binding transcriptional LysR family regulator
MNLRFVEAFYWVGTFKSITRAAEKLYLTQPGVSSRIQALEEELGVILIDRREKQQLRLTAAGLRLMSYAERLLMLQRDLRDELGSGIPAAANLRIGAIESVLHTWLIPLIEDLRQGNPELELELTVETTPVLVEQIRRGNLDLIFAALPVSGDGIRSRTLPSLELVFVGRGPAGRPWTLAEIAEHEVLTFQRGSQPQVALTDMFKAARIEPKKVHTVSSISAMVKLLEGGFGIATLPRPAAEALINQLPDFSILNSDIPLAPLPLHGSYRNDPTSSTIDEVLSRALNFIRVFGGETTLQAVTVRDI